MASLDNEFSVASCFDDATAIQHQNLVGHPHRREAVADQQRRFPGDELPEVLEEQVFSLCVQG